VQSYYAASLDREMGCTEREWLSWLPRAVGAHVLALGDGRASVAIDGGALELRWTPLPPRAIGLARFPRLAVQFRFEGVTDEVRQRFMRYFDLYMQRGGG
jgi:hypothetical protein